MPEDDRSEDIVPEVNPAEAARRVGQGAFLLDVRNQDEFDDARVPGALLIPLGELMERIEEVPENREIVVLCRSGGRSGMAVQWLRGQGLAAFNITGGILDWEEEGLPVDH